MSIEDEEEQRLAAEADENMAAWEAGIERIKADLRLRHPEFFDASGELRVGAASRALRQRAGGKSEFTKEEFLALVGKTPLRRADAS